MSSFEQFRATLLELIKKVPDVQRELQSLAGGNRASKPESATQDRLIQPFLDALEFGPDFRTTQATIIKAGNTGLRWVDYRLDRSPNDRRGLMLVEVKPVTETGDIWKKHHKQTRRYLRDYQLALQDREPVRWIMLTNFCQLSLLNIADREPFLSLTYDQFEQNADLLYRLLNRSQLINDQITSIYQEKRRTPLGKSFLRDLKLWRLLLANGLVQAQPGLTLEQAGLLSQQILNRIILIRALETSGLHPYYSLVHEYDQWFTSTRNHEHFPFFDTRLTKVFDDIEMDLNTDLFKKTLMEHVRSTLVDSNGDPISQISLANEYARSLVDPDVIWSDKEHDIRELIGYQTGQQRFAYSTPYNYDFNTLTTDIIGQVYEQFLAHQLSLNNGHVLIKSEQTLRQQEGAYYTPMPVVNFLVQGTVSKAVERIRGNAEALLQQQLYTEAQKEIDSLRTIKVLDLACGSGTFLIAAFETILMAYRWWNNRLTEIQAEHFGNDMLEFFRSGLQQERNPGDTVLRHCIFGIDKDAQAVEMAKLNLWLLLLRTQPEDYARTDGKAPRQKLPNLASNILNVDALYPSPNIDLLLGPDDHQRIIVGNPPWGADTSAYASEVLELKLAQGQFDSCDLFIEQATGYLRPEDMLGYVVPDSILQLPDHAGVREFLLQHYAIDAVVKLGEGVFEDVFRGAVVISATRSDNVDPAHLIRCRIVVKAERDRLLKATHGNALQDLLDVDGYTVKQRRFAQNRHLAFDIFVKEDEEPVIMTIDQDALGWQSVMYSSRGVELSKNGQVMACPHCGVWQNIPQRQKNKSFKRVICINPKCARSISYEECVHSKIIENYPTINCTQPIVVGVGVNRYQIAERRYLDTTKVKVVPLCPCPDPIKPKQHCRDFDPTLGPFVPGEVRTCSRCHHQYSEGEVREWKALGIDYKSPQLYEGEKLLVRKTGRGIYATIDTSEAYTNQVVFIFKLKPRTSLADKHKQLRLGYILGVLNSRMMLYRYYKLIGDIEWKSFSYVTQKTIMDLPVRAIDFEDTRQAYLHSQIADLVDGVIASNNPPDPATDAKIEDLVRQLYGVNMPAESDKIDQELARIERYGPLLGMSIESDQDTADDI